MKELTFSIFDHGGKTIQTMSRLLGQFEQETHIQVRLDVNPWSDGWKRQVEIAIYREVGPDVSETGNTWVRDLAHMDALRPFSLKEINKITGGKNYLPSAWAGATTTGPGNNSISWAIPFSSDVRVVYYRRDLLRRADVDENMAFQDIPTFDHMLEKLNANGIEPCVILPTLAANINLQNLASWIWKAGGDFFDSDGTELVFDEPVALEGIKAYFRLGRYLANYRLDQNGSDNMFKNGQAALLVSGYINPEELTNHDVRKNLGIAPVLGTSFVGPNDLVIWKQSRHPEEALELIQFLCRIDSGALLFPVLGLPPYQEGWESSTFAKAEYQAQMQAMRDGRSYPDSRLWALVEKRLSDVIPKMWEAVLANPGELDAIVEREITVLAQRLRFTLES